MTEIHSFGVEPISCHSFNGDRTRIAFSANSNEVQVHRRDAKSGGWIGESVLDQHDMRVSSVDWAPKSNRIVTCSADRNAYVWNLVDGIWKPTLVLLRMNRAATCVRWSPNEDKFAIGSGAKIISVCHFEEQNDWWVSKHLKKQIKSTITCLDWHPNNAIIACGSTDYKVRVYSAFVKEVDLKEPAATPWSAKVSPGTVIAEFSAASGSWIHDVSFSPEGNRLAWVAHDSSISVVDAGRNLSVATLRTRFLPCLSLVWSSATSLVAAGHDCYPMLFKHDESSGKLEYVEKIDKSERKEADGFSAMRKFRDLDRRGIENHAGPGGDSLETVHQNTIIEVRVYEPGRVSTVGLDGKLVVWEVGKGGINNSMRGMKINSA